MEKQQIKGWKVFDENLKCKDYQFEIGKRFKQKGKPILCEHGFHFYTQPAHLFNYYSFNSKNRVCEIIAYGKCDIGDDKACCNDIEIVKELNWHEVLSIINTGVNNTGRNNSGNRNSGNRNSGDCNSGDWNSGYRNSGYRNSGNRNSGDWNSGYRNSGNRNSGDRNSGDCNSGYRNSGDCNSGYWNSGNWNSTNYSSGIFNTKEQPTPIFNGTATVLMSNFQKTDNYKALFSSDFPLIEWINESLMTEQEKIDNPNFHVQEGYLKTRTFKEAAAIWWLNMTEENKQLIQEIPGFTASIFTEVTGIKLD